MKQQGRVTKRGYSSRTRMIRCRKCHRVSLVSAKKRTLGCVECAFITIAKWCRRPLEEVISAFETRDGKLRGLPPKWV